MRARSSDPRDIDFSALRLADAEIIGVRTEQACLIVDYRDWRERRATLIFHDVLGYQAFGPEGCSLSHDDPLVEQACEVAGKDRHADFAVFSFVSAWNGSNVLRVVARRVTEGTGQT